MSMEIGDPMTIVFLVNGEMNFSQTDWLTLNINSSYEKQVCKKSIII